MGGREQRQPGPRNPVSFHTLAYNLWVIIAACVALWNNVNHMSNISNIAIVSC